jgi:hypothetical protein
MHLNEGFTKVLVERTEGLGLANGGVFWEIPTHLIPFHLRNLGSRFLVTTDSIWPEIGDTAEELRAAGSNYQVDELTQK